MAVLWGSIWTWDSRRKADAIASAEAQLLQKDIEKNAVFRGIEGQLGNETWISGQFAGLPIREEIDDKFRGVIYGISVDCLHCVRNIPALNRLVDANVAVIGLAIGADEPRVITWISENEARFPVIVRPTGSLLPLFERAGYPYTLVVWDGRLSFGVLGRLSDQQVERLLQGLRR